jgi:glycosyltransferase involved in cell wall biosynthesis
MPRKIVVLLKGYPRLSETFIAQELRGLEQSGLELVIASMRRPTDKKRHPVHDEIVAPVRYLPEYLHEEPGRVAAAVLRLLPRSGFWRALGTLVADLRRDFTRNRLRRFGQAAVLAAEWPADAGWLHAHFLHTPASVAAYASRMSGIGWTCSAHAKDIWTSQDWDLRGKLGAARWVVTCTRAGFEHLRSLAPDPSTMHLSYHGLNLERFAPFAGERAPLDGSDPARPITVLSVGRAVEKKGLDTLLGALALLPPGLNWRFVHVGGGDLLEKLKAQAAELGIADRAAWHGALAQADVLDLYRRADIFALPCRIAADGDRDGLPNVLVEASSQGLTCISTPVSGVPELIADDVNGLLVPPDEPRALAFALERAMREPALRQRLGNEAERVVRTRFDYHQSVRDLKVLFEAEWAR